MNFQGRNTLSKRLPFYGKGNDFFLFRGNRSLDGLVCRDLTEDHTSCLQFKYHSG